jgi:hypothetical protein
MTLARGCLLVKVVTINRFVVLGILPALVRGVIVTVSVPDTYPVAQPAG